MLVELAGGEPAARSELRRAALWEAWRTWRRAGRALAGAIYTLAMTLIYLVTGPLATLGLRAMRRRARWQLAAPIAQPLAGPATQAPPGSATQPLAGPATLPPAGSATQPLAGSATQAPAGPAALSARPVREAGR